jgi:hypothetical protein
MPRASLARSTVSPETLAAKWNKTFPLGTRVRYWDSNRERIGRVSITDSEAYVTTGVPVVCIEGRPAPCPLSQVEPLPPTGNT